MRYKISNTNITINHRSCETEAIVAAAFKILVPKVALKLLFLQHEDLHYSQLEVLQGGDQRFRVIKGRKDLRTICQQLRIVESYGNLIIAPNSKPEKLNKVYWSALCEKIKELAQHETET